MDRSTKQKINKETQTLNNTIDQLDLFVVFRTFHPKIMNFTFFSSTQRTFSRIDHILGHKASLGKFKKIEITLGLEDSLEKEMSTHSSILAWEIPWTQEPGRIAGSQRVRHG